MKKRRLLPWVLATASALVAAGVMAQPAETSRFDRWSTDNMTTPRSIDTSKNALHMSDAQEALWAQADADSQTLRQAMLDNFERMHASVTAELARSTPDFITIANIEEATAKANQQLRRKMQDTWLQVYVILSGEQQAMVRQAMLNSTAQNLHMHGLSDLDGFQMIANDDPRRPTRRQPPSTSLLHS